MSSAYEADVEAVSLPSHGCGLRNRTGLAELMRLNPRPRCTAIIRRQVLMKKLPPTGERFGRNLRAWIRTL